MAITSFLRDQAFEPETVETMARAFAQICEDLGVTERTDPLTELVARHIIDMAQSGIKSKTALYLGAMLKFKGNLQ